MANVCKGGCGKELPSTNKNGYAWGHIQGCPKELPPPSTLEATDEALEADGAEEVQLNLTEAQLDRIWQSLPLTEKALGIHTALTAIRE